MILKRLKRPIELQKLEAVIPRLRPNFPRLSDIKHEAARSYKGYIGEIKVNNHLEQLADSFTILQDVGLKSKEKNFQIDTLMISDYAIYIIESKNYSGTITFNTYLNQFTRHDGQTETGYRHPITQAETAKFNLENWLHDRNLNHIPVHCFVAISEPSTIISVIGDQEKIARVVAHGEYIPRKILQIDKQLSERAAEGGGGGQPSWNQHRVGQRILRECIEIEIYVLEKYNITFRDILPGVLCPKCEHLGMLRDYGIWVCEKCECRSKRAHVRTLNEFFLLIRPSITNRECRWLLRIGSRYLAIRLLRMANLYYQKEIGRWIPI